MLLCLQVIFNKFYRKRLSAAEAIRIDRSFVSLSFYSLQSAVCVIQFISYITSRASRSISDPNTASVYCHIAHTDEGLAPSCLRISHQICSGNSVTALCLIAPEHMLTVTHHIHGPSCRNNPYSTIANSESAHSLHGLQAKTAVSSRVVEVFRPKDATQQNSSVELSHVFCFASSLRTRKNRAHSNPIFNCIYSAADRRGVYGVGDWFHIPYCAKPFGVKSQKMVQYTNRDHDCSYLDLGSGIAVGRSLFGIC